MAKQRPESPTSTCGRLCSSKDHLNSSGSKYEEKKRSRRVSFSDDVHISPSRNSLLTTDEIESSWYQSCDKQVVKKEMNETLRLLKNGMIINESTHCSRGIEHFLDLTAFIKERNETILSVLTEQDLQRFEGIEDDELVAIASRQFSSKHQEKARLNGLNDQEGAKCFNAILAQENKLIRCTLQSQDSRIEKSR